MLFRSKRNSRMSEPNEDEMHDEEPTCETTTTSLATQSTDEQESSDEIEECLYCQEDHTIEECSNYRNENLENRTKYAKQNGMCFNCLVRGHMTRFCEESMRCSKCSRKHHSLLHDDNYVHKPREDQANQSHQATTTNLCTLQNPTVFLRTLPVRIYKNGLEVIGVALLDCGTKSSLATEELFKKLQARSQKQDLRIKTITSQQSNHESMSTDLTVKSLDGKGMITNDNV